MASGNHFLHPRDWVLLVALSVLWGGSFFFVGVALKELPPFTLVFLRAVIAVLALGVIAWAVGAAMPKGSRQWFPFVVMALLNFVVPFSCLVAGQTFISGGLASILNATTPLFTVGIMAAAGEERLSTRRVVGALAGLIGVAILRGMDVSDAGTGAGVVLCLGAACSYGFSALYARRHLVGVPPLTTATAQMVASTLITGMIAASLDRPWSLPVPSVTAVLAIVALGIFSTALAYILFFRIVARSGPSNVMLVTLLIPIPAILLGTFVLGETIRSRELVGAAVIGSALLVIDGRMFAWAQWRWRTSGRSG